MIRRCFSVLFAFACLAALHAHAASAQAFDRTASGRARGADPQQPPGAGSAEPYRLSLEDAIARGLRANVAARTQEADLLAARGQRWVSLGDLLPSASARLGLTRQEINLAAFGFSLPGFPTIVGPFNLHDARLYVSQPIVDLNALYASRASAASLRAAELTADDTRELVSLAVRDLYLRSVAAESRLSAAGVQSATARALLTQATDLKNAGIVAGIDVVRAQVQVRTQEQRAIAAENDFEKQKLQLARAIGWPLGAPFVLTDPIVYAPLQAISLDQALSQAFTARRDYQAAEARLTAAVAERHAALANNLPSLHAMADYGQIGRTPEDTHSTYAVTAQLRVPIFDGATTRGRVLEADALVQRRRAERDDYRARVEYEVRAAYLDVHAAEEQLRAADDAVKLATAELEQTRDRFAAGVAGNIEVVRAQEEVAAATENYISSLYAHNIAKAALAHAIGSH